MTKKSIYESLNTLQSLIPVKTEEKTKQANGKKNKKRKPISMDKETEKAEERYRISTEGHT